MKYFLLKVLLEDKKVVYRDLEISATCTLKELHELIKQAFDFKGNQLASFILEKEGWGNDEEFPLENLTDQPTKEMHEVDCAEVFKDEEAQLVYIYDYLNEWKFYIEVIDKLETDSTKQIAKIVKRHGASPNETERNLDGADAENILMNALLGDDLADDEDLFDDDPFSSGNMESLDDYEEFQ